MRRLVRRLRAFQLSGLWSPVRPRLATHFVERLLFSADVFFALHSMKAQRRSQHLGLSCERYRVRPSF
jgi:hypothetical protein